MKTIGKLLASILALTMLFAVCAPALAISPAEQKIRGTDWNTLLKQNKDDTIKDLQVNALSSYVSNPYIEFCVDGDSGSVNSGRFTIGTIEGNPKYSTDNDKRLLYGHGSPWSSYTTIYIDGDLYYFEADNTVFDYANQKTVSTMTVSNVQIIQTLTIVANNSTGIKDTVQVSYSAKNLDMYSKSLGIRIMLDTMLGSNDGAPFKVPSLGNVLTEKQLTGNAIPQYWQAFDSLENPSVFAVGTFYKPGDIKPDKVQFTNWSRVYETSWNYSISDGYPVTGDSAVSMYWNSRPLPAGTTFRVSTYYGAGYASEGNDLDIGNTTVPTSGFAVMVLSQSGNIPIEGATVTASNNLSSVTTDSSGIARFHNMPVGSGNTRSANISISKPGYQSMTVVREVSTGGLTGVSLCPDDGQPHILTAIGSYNGRAVDLLSNYMYFKSDIQNTEQGSNNTNDYQLTVDASSSQGINKYQLIQGGEIVAESNTASFTIPVLTGTAVDPSAFGANPRITKLKAGKVVYLRVVDSVGNVSERKALGLKIAEPELYGNTETSGKLELGEKFKLQVPSNIPFIGDTEIELGWNGLPFEIEINENGKVQFAINGKKEASTGKVNMQQVKDEYDDVLEAIVAGRSGAAKAFGGSAQSFGAGKIDVKANIMGYGEGFLDLNGNLTLQIGVVITISQSASYTQTYFLGWVPVYVSVGEKVSVSGKIQASIVRSNGQIHCSGALGEINPKIVLNADGGVGANGVLSVGASGRATLSWLHRFTDKYNRVSLTGELYLVASAWLFKAEKKLASGTWTIYDGFSASSIDNESMGDNPDFYDTSEYTLIGRDYLDTLFSMQAITENDYINVVKNGVYPNAQPRLVTTGGDSYLFWLDDNTSRSDENRTMLVYSKSSDVVSWSTPVSIVESGGAVSSLLLPDTAEKNGDETSDEAQGAAETSNEAESSRETENGTTTSGEINESETPEETENGEATFGEEKAKGEVSDEAEDEGVPSDATEEGTTGETEGEPDNNTSNLPGETTTSEPEDESGSEGQEGSILGLDDVPQALGTSSYITETADFNFDVCVDGTDIYIAWCKANTMFETGVELDEMASATEIYTAVLDTLTGDIHNIICLTANETADTLPVITRANGVTTVAWINNGMENGLFGNNEYSLCYATSDNWADIEKVGCDEVIVSADIGILGDEMKIAYVVDDDSDFNTVDDREIYTLTPRASASSFTSNETVDSNPTFAMLDGAHVMFWYSDGNLAYVADTSEEPALVFESVPDTLSDAYFVANGSDGSTMVIWEAMSSTADSQSTAIYACSYLESGWSNAYKLFDTQSELTSSINGYLDGENVVVAYLCTQDVSDNSPATSVNVAVSTDRVDIELVDVSYDQSQVFPGENLDLTITVSNNGNVGIDEFLVKVDGAVIATIENADLGAGETAEYNVSGFTVPGTVNEALEKNLMLEVENDIDDSNNALTFIVGYSDLSVSVNRLMVNGNDSFNIVVENRSLVPSNALLRIFADEEGGAVLYEEDLGQIINGTAKSLLINVNSVAGSALVNVFYVQVSSNVSELFISNNSELVYVGADRADTRSLVVNASIGGSVIGDPSGYYGEGDEILLEAVAEEGFVFIGWYTEDGGEFVDESSLITTYTMPANDATIYAMFDQLEFASLEITSPANKLIYYVDEEFDVSGLAVSARYVARDMVYESRIDVTNFCQISGFNSATTGNRTIVISYNDGLVTRYASYNVTVIARPKASTVTIRYGQTNVTGQVLGIDLAAPNKTIQLSAIVTPADAKQGVTWKTSSTKVATVDQNGLVTGIAKGTATITATATDGSGKQATVKINVATMVKSIILSGTSEMAAGKSIQLTANIAPADATNKKIVWTTSNAGIATVNTSGKVTAKNVGGTQTVTITAAATDGSGISGSKVITVRPVAAAVNILKDSTNVTGSTLGIDLATSAKTIQLSASISPVDASQGILWSSTSAKVATVAQNGLVTGIGKGSATITATATDGSGKKATVKINVATMVKSIILSGSSEVAAGKSIQMTANISPSDATNKKVDWTTSNANIATVSSSGKVTAKNIGYTQSCIITAIATDGSGISGSKVITVRPAVAIVTIWMNSKNVTGGALGIDLAAANRTLQLSADVSPNDAGRGILWTTSSSKVATVDQNGLVTGLAKGTATITATATDGSGKKAAVKINVATMVKSIVVMGSGEVAAGKSTQLAASVGPADATNKKLIWTSSNTAVATVSSSGKVTAKSITGTQTVLITATAADGSGVSGSLSITVRPAALIVYIFSGDTNVNDTTQGINLASNRTMQLSANVYPVYAGQGVLWTSSNTKLATVDRNGLVTGIAKGTATITATATDGSGKKAAVKISMY